VVLLEITLTVQTFAQFGGWVVDGAVVVEVLVFGVLVEVEVDVLVLVEVFVVVGVVTSGVVGASEKLPGPTPLLVQ